MALKTDARHTHKLKPQPLDWTLIEQLTCAFFEPEPNVSQWASGVLWLLWSKNTAQWEWAEPFSDMPM